MLEGSGLLATAMRRYFMTDPQVFIFAAGVSNSSCTNASEFEREQARVDRHIEANPDVRRFVYFSTCSVADPTLAQSPYVQHKLAMEQRVRRHPGHLIVRLPQLAGRTPNPHTLLNFLYARISRSEAFVLWQQAQRNVLDVEDAALIVSRLAAREDLRGTTVNVANRRSHPVAEIVRTIERVVGKPAIFESRQGGSAYGIDVSIVDPVISALGIDLDDGYLQRVVEKYYGA